MVGVGPPPAAHGDGGGGAGSRVIQCDSGERGEETEMDSGKC